MSNESRSAFLLDGVVVLDADASVHNSVVFLLAPFSHRIGSVSLC